MIGVDAYSSLPRGPSGSGEDDGFYSAPPGYRWPTSEDHHRVQSWNFVAKQPIANLNSANPGQDQHSYGAFHLNLNHLSSSINNAPALADVVSSSQPWQPVGASGHSGWPDQENGSHLIQGYVDELRDAGNQWLGSQQDLYNWVTQPCDGYDGHDVDRESIGFDHSVGVQSPLDGCGSLIPYSTSRTPQLRDDPQTPSLSTSATTPESTGNSGPPTPEPSLPKSIPKSQSATFQFVQYTAGSDIGDRTSKKRLTHDDDDKDGSAKIVRKDVMRDQEGTFKGLHIVLHPGEKIVKKVRRTEEQKRTSALARKNGACPNPRSKPIQVEMFANNKQSFAGPAVNEPLFIKRETVFRLTDFSKPDVGVIRLELTQNIGKHHLVYFYSSKQDYLHMLKDNGGLTWDIVSMAIEYAKTKKTKYSNTKFLEQAFHTAKIILSRFHYACNGSVPLGLDWKASQVSSMAKLGPKEVEFMQRIQKEFKKREHDLRNLPSKHEYETDGHWYHQLFIEDWDTSPVDVKDPYE
ncbi:hypothetical protein NEUTE1DRAFT_121467 [Neurospora tetrasperma FGSC 2508]|uniref:Uncharacterized protein n=1 Tax=Neurospora tetrasperma (strain FGSC 2508 / ATCC MYA-4615 / P0657) TaxID=510951 RepID=F8MI07_NEUT8|nr:uncharacterized protein NEUTE1DRAFT_121467 [Neurospora tetrasperma FGSC 2508]EGO59715.1 hypothetical protein NEUTE1DRAFT_121467 [Neurospora tetrasperma FGSC 2508]EGZ73854.1 hypothetical protein NEUTE2DRAFT_87490 [Neurospora tetrasperma FGSC 2509]